MYSLYLDDERTPLQDAPCGEWVICRTATEAALYIKEHGAPEYMSLDCYLGWQARDGNWFLDWYLRQDRREKGAYIGKLEDIDFHSSNPEWAQNMRFKFNAHLRKFGLEMGCLI